MQLTEELNKSKVMFKQIQNEYTSSIKSLMAEKALIEKKT